MSFLFGSKAQRTFKKIQDLASSDMVDQAAVMVEEELDTLLEDHDISSKLVPFLMDIGHPDLGGRIGESIVRTHSDLRLTITRLLEEKQAQFPRSIELLRVIWKSRLHQRDFNGLMDILGRTERVTVSRFSDSIESSAQALNGVTGRELGAGIDRILAWAIISLHRGDPSTAMDILVDAAERCRFPEESLSRLSGWIAARTSGTDMEVNLKRVQVLTAIGDRERAITEIPSLYEAEKEILDKAISLVEKELVPNDKTPKSKISLARLMGRAGRINEASLILDPLVEKHHDSSILEQAVTGMVIGSSGSARVHLLQARLRLFRGENTQALDSIERAFGCPDVADSPVVDICRSFIESGIDRDGLVTGKLGEFLVEKGSVEEAVSILALSVRTDPEWVFEKLQQLLKRDRTSAAVLTLLAVVLLVLKRGGEAAATLKHLSARKDVKSKQDIVSVLSDFDYLMPEHVELRRLRAASGSSNGRASESAGDWIELLISGEKVGQDGCMVIFDSGAYKKRAAEIVESSFKPDSLAGELVLAASKIEAGVPEESSEHLIQAMESPELVDRVTGLVASLPFSAVAAMNPGKLFKSLNDNNRGDVVAKLLPLLASSGSEEWMDDLASEMILRSDRETAFFRMRYFIELGKPGTGAAAVSGLHVEEGNLTSLIEGCKAFVAGDMQLATSHLSKAASNEETATLAKNVLGNVIEREKGSAKGAIALARAEISTGNIQGASEVLKTLLREKDVLEFLEEAVREVPASHELHGCLALARLFSGNPEGYREAAGTALEGESGMAEELVSRGAEFSLENDYAIGMVFAAEVGLANVENFDPMELLFKALCLDPGLYGRVKALDFTNDLLAMLVSLATTDASGFTALEIPSWATIPVGMITSSREEWSKQKAVPALIQLEILAVSTGHHGEAHEIRKVLAEAGEDRSEALLHDAMENHDLITDFLKLCTDSATAANSMDRLFPNGISDADEKLVEEAAQMLLRCGPKDSLYKFTKDLFEAGSDAFGKTAGFIVGEYVPTAGEEGSLSVAQVVELLLMSGRYFEAFSMARGDSELLARVREVVSEHDSGSDSFESLLRSGRESEVPEDAAPMVRGEALWRSGERQAACGVWRKAYAETSDPVFLSRLSYAYECMGAASDFAATRRLLSENHPEHLLRTGNTGQQKNKLAMITYSIR